jgi:hypothetical protein
LLHLTNGDHALAMLRHAGMRGDFLPWRDVLHEGPVRAGLTLEQLSRERAAFIADAGWRKYSEVLADFSSRDQRVARASGEDEVVLWFEHDLYDQLQLVQVLDLLADRLPRRLTLVCEAEYLGPMAPSRAASLFAIRKDVTRAQIDAARRAWRAFTCADPRGIPIEVPELRFLGPALRRLLEEYPWKSDGLSRLERAIFAALQDGPRPFDEILRAVREEPAFLGDTVLLWHLERLRDEGSLRLDNEAWASTAKQPRRSRERWLGGVQVLPQARWRYDPALGRIVE